MQKTAALPQDVLELAEELGIGERIFAIVDLTQEMFPGSIAVETGYDPAWPDDAWITFLVTDRRTLEESMQQELEWNRRLLELIPDCPRAVGLSVTSHEADRHD